MLFWILRSWSLNGLRRRAVFAWLLRAVSVMRWKEHVSCSVLYGPSTEGDRVGDWCEKWMNRFTSCILHSQLGHHHCLLLTEDWSVLISVHCVMSGRLVFRRLLYCRTIWSWGVEVWMGVDLVGPLVLAKCIVNWVWPLLLVHLTTELTSLSLNVNSDQWWGCQLILPALLVVGQHSVWRGVSLHHCHF